MLLTPERPPPQTSQSESPDGFLTQKELDPDFVAFNSENRRYHFPARIYLPFRGVFAQVDPVLAYERYPQAYSDNSSTYDYVGSNPLVNVDPWGLQGISVTSKDIKKKKTGIYLVAIGQPGPKTLRAEDYSFASIVNDYETIVILDKITIAGERSCVDVIACVVRKITFIAPNRFKGSAYFLELTGGKWPMETFKHRWQSFGGLLKYAPTAKIDGKLHKFGKVAPPTRSEETDSYVVSPSYLYDCNKGVEIIVSPLMSFYMNTRMGDKYLGWDPGLSPDGDETRFGKPETRM